jgi:hypothetical protein
LPAVAERHSALAAQPSADSGRRTWLLSTMATAAGVLAASATAARGASAQPRPFQTLVSGTIQPQTQTNFQLSGSGVASHLGKSRHGGPVVITAADPNTGVITDTLTETFTAANGDTLTLLCQQIATPVSPGVYQAADQWVAVGGTGRFDGVTGSGGGSTLVDLNALTYVKQCSGSITY